MPKFLSDEVCERCKGLILAEPWKRTEFDEENFSYSSLSVWVCSVCGREHTLQSEPYYEW